MKKNELEFYEQITDWNFQMFNIKSEKLTNWNMYEILNLITNEKSKILDLGTGGGEKVLKEFPKNVKEILATDFSTAMINTAKKNLKNSDRKNVKFRVMNNLHMDVKDDYFDVIVARNTETDPKQIYKALKKDGYLLLRGVDMYDCHELKRIFGRGQAYKDTKPISIIDYENVLDAGFKDVELIPIYEREYFKDIETLVAFLKKVPMIDDYCEEDNCIKEIDLDTLNLYVKRNTYPKGIRLLRRYYGIIARK